MTLRVVPDGVAPGAPHVVLPQPDVVFLARAGRLRALAAGHPAGAWLGALALVCEAQHAAVQTPGAALDRIVDHLGGAALPPPARDALARLRGAPAETRAAWAESLSGGDAERPDDVLALFVAAAVQVEHTARAARVAVRDVAPAAVDCPVCRAPAAAGVVTGDTRTRYLACSRCSSAWHRVRVQCATCGSPAALSYYGLDDGRAPGVKAEACARCQTYLKLFYEEQRPGVEPLADDAATLALDLLLGEDGHARGGVNPLLRADWGR